VQKALGGPEREMKARTEFVHSIERKSIAQEPEEELVVSISPSKSEKTGTEEGSEREGRGTKSGGAE
jgi:hypothetical protein